MLNETELALLRTLKLESRADEAAVGQLRQSLGGSLPADYLELLNYANGGAGFVGGRGYILLWRIQEIPEICSANGVERSAPGLLPFASDGGGNVFAFDRRSSQTRIVEVPLIGICWEDAKFRANSVGELLSYLGSQ